MKRMAFVLLLAAGVVSTHQAAAQTNIGFNGIGGSIAYVSPENIDGVFGLGIFADMGQLSPRIGFEPSLEYWSHSEEAFGTKASIRDVTLGARGKYYFETTSPKMRPFAGAGLGLHFLHSETSVTVPGFPTMSVDVSDTKLGLDLGGGIASQLGPRDEFRAEAWYGIVSDVSQLALRVGIRHSLQH